MYVKGLVLLGGVDLRQQAFEVAKAVRAGGVLQRLILRKDVDETVADVVAVAPEGVPAAIAKLVDHVPDFAVGGEVRHAAAPAAAEARPL